MADTIESFVEKLQKEGVEAGRAQAEKLLEDAGKQADALLADGRKEADQIVQQARAEAERMLRQGREDLALAARDVKLKLRHSIVQTLQTVLKTATTEVLGDRKFLAELIRQVVLEYARKDAEQAWPIEVRVNEQMLHGLADWILGDARKEDIHIELKDNLRSAGFEYSFSGGVVEVTPESVTAVLSEMLAPRLRELLESSPPK